MLRKSSFAIVVTGVARLQVDNLTYREFRRILPSVADAANLLGVEASNL